MAIDNSMLLLIKSSMLGEGEPDLGEKLLRAFLAQLLESGSIPARIIFMNSGIFLTTEGSSMLDLITQFASLGSEKDRLVVGKSTNMRDSVRALLNSDKILQI